MRAREHEATVSGMAVVTSGTGVSLSGALASGRKSLLYEGEEGSLVLTQEGQHRICDGALWRIVAQLLPVSGQPDVTRLESMQHLNCCHRAAPC